MEGPQCVLFVTQRAVAFQGVFAFWVLSEGSDTNLLLHTTSVVVLETQGWMGGGNTGAGCLTEMNSGWPGHGVDNDHW